MRLTTTGLVQCMMLQSVVNGKQMNSLTCLLNNYASELRFCRPATTPPTISTDTGTTTAFPTGFPSLKQNDIVVFTGTAATNTWTAVPQTDYSVNSQNANNVQQVVFNTAPGADVMIMSNRSLHIGQDFPSRAVYPCTGS